jgi:multidrug resistance protein, MATE family
VGYALAFHFGLGAHGLWWGLVAGLSSVAGLLFLRVHRRLGREMVRVDLDRARR